MNGISRFINPDKVEDTNDRTKDFEIELKLLA